MESEIKEGDILVVRIGDYVRERWCVIEAKVDKSYFLGRLVKKNGEFDKRGDSRGHLVRKDSVEKL